MSAAARLDYTYRYPFSSELLRDGTAWGLRLATCGSRGEEHAPHFFSGQMRKPGTTATMLLTLAKVVNTRFHMPRAMLQLDPVVTSNEELLRFEGFSSCCGVYARVDLDAEGFDRDIQGRGTTNVDFNTGMRGSRIRPRSTRAMRLSSIPYSIRTRSSRRWRCSSWR